jgi:pyruvate dehydrogenase E1 component beta subunit
MTMVEALNHALRQEMERDEDVVVLGEDVGRDGGVFRVTEGLLEAFGEERVVDTPVSEAVIVGASLGMAAHGSRPICEIQFSGFSYYAMHQIESHVARFRWRTRGRFPVPMVIRMPYGAGVRALEHHSESKEVFFTHVPGLTVVAPSGPRLARSLLVSAIRSPDPVVFLEPKLLYRKFREEVPEEEETHPLGEARVAREGTDLTVVAWGAMLPRTLAVADEMAAEEGVEAQVVDLLTLSPLDMAPVLESVRRTGRAVVVHEAHRSYGPGAEIVSRIVEEAFWRLEAPVRRVTAPDVHVPFFARENEYLPTEDRIRASFRAVLEA